MVYNYNANNEIPTRGKCPFLCPIDFGIRQTKVSVVP